MESHNEQSLPVAYVQSGLALIRIARGEKGPRTPGWQQEASAIRTTEAAAKLVGCNIGIAHRWCGTCAVDVDDYEQSAGWLAERDIDLGGLLGAEDAVQIKSGRPNRAKLLYRLPSDVAWLPTLKPDGIGLELRCASRDGTATVQDVLPPSIHPDTEKPYEWGGAGDWHKLPTLPPSLLAVWRSLSTPVVTQRQRRSSTAEGKQTVSEGGRNAHLTKLAGAMRRTGTEQHTIETALLAENAARCVPPLSDAEVRTIAASVSRYAAAEGRQELLQQCAPEPLRRPLPPQEPYPLAELGEVLRPAAESLRRVIQAPDAIVGGALLAAASLATQAHADVLIDGRRIPLSLWLLNVAESGERKSAVDSEAMRAAREHERTLGASYSDDVVEHDAATAEWNARREQAKADVKNNKGRGLAESLVDLGPAPTAPLIPRVTAADFTAEGLFKLLQGGYPSIGAFTDEAAQVFGGHGMQRETIMRTAGALCRLWDRGELDRVRSADGAQKLFGRRFAMHLLAQPVIAERALSDDVLAGQGFLARCLLAWPDGTAGSRPYRAESLAEDWAMMRLTETLLRLHRAPLPVQVDQPQTLEPRTLTLTADAFALWREAHDTIERGMAPSGPFVQVKPWASKTPEQVLRIAGVLTLIQDAEVRQIDVATIRRAIEIALWHLGEARRLVGMSELSPEVRDAEAVLNWCHETGREQLYSTIAMNRGPARIREGGKFRTAMKALESAGWAHATDGPVMLDGKLRRNVWRIVPAGEGR